MRFCPHGVNCNSRPEKNRKGSHFFLSCMNLFPQKMEDSFVSKTASRVETCLCFQSHGSASMCLMVTRFVTHTHTYPADGTQANSIASFRISFFIPEDITYGLKKEDYADVL